MPGTLLWHSDRLQLKLSSIDLVFVCSLCSNSASFTFFISPLGEFQILASLLACLYLPFPYCVQNFHGQGLMRPSAVGSPGSPAPSTSQSVQSHNQPWLSSGPQGKPPLPPPSSFRPQMNSPSMQQRSHIPQQHIPSSTGSQQQHMSSMQPPQPPKPSAQLQEHHGQQFPSSRVPQSLPHQQPSARTQGSTMQKPSSMGTVQPNTVQPGPQSRIAITESDESGNRILSKRSIHELVHQVSHCIIFQHQIHTTGTGWLQFFT